MKAVVLVRDLNAMGLLYSFPVSTLGLKDLGSGKILKNYFFLFNKHEDIVWMLLNKH